jgi:hypothetical protein
MIRRWTPGTIVFDKSGRTLTISGEAYSQASGGTVWIGDLKSMLFWDPPHDDQPIDDAERRAIINEIMRENEQIGAIEVRFE